MEEVNKINPKMSLSTPSPSKSPEEKHTTIYAAVILIIAFIGIVFYMIYNNASEDVKDVKEDRIIYTHEEKLEILKGLAGNPEDIPSIEERRKITEGLAGNPEDIPSIEERRKITEGLAGNSESKSVDTIERQEEKPDILYSL